MDSCTVWSKSDLIACLLSVCTKVNDVCFHGVVVD